MCMRLWTFMCTSLSSSMRMGIGQVCVSYCVCVCVAYVCVYVFVYVCLHGDGASHRWRHTSILRSMTSSVWDEPDPWAADSVALYTNVQAGCCHASRFGLVFSPAIFEIGSSFHCKHHATLCVVEQSLPRHQDKPHNSWDVCMCVCVRVCDYV